MGSVTHQLVEDDCTLAEIVQRLVARTGQSACVCSVQEPGATAVQTATTTCCWWSRTTRRLSGDGKLAYRVLWDTGAAADVIVWERSRFERRSRVVCSLPATVGSRRRDARLASAGGARPQRGRSGFCRRAAPDRRRGLPSYGTTDPFGKTHDVNALAR